MYSKYGREIYVCAKSGGVEPDGNLALRTLIDKAKKDQVPSHVIDKALEKAKGGGGEDYSTARYEGYGPGNAMVIVECLTDNPNRTFGDVRLCFTKTKCKIGTSGSVGHMFDHSAIFVFAGNDEDAVLEALMEADVDVSDVECEDGKTLYLIHISESTRPERISYAVLCLKKKSLHFLSLLGLVDMFNYRIHKIYFLDCISCLFQ